MFRSGRYIVFIFLAVLFLISCSGQKKTFKLIKVAEYSSSKVTDSSLIKILKKKNNININIEYTLSEDEALKQLKNKNTDLVIIPNNARSSETDFRTLVPLLPRVLMILTNKEVESMKVKELFEKGNIYFEDRSRLDSIIFRKLYYNFNIDEKKINAHLIEELDISHLSDSLEVYVGLTHINNVLVKRLTNLNWHFFSLDNVNDYRKGSRIEGFTMMNTSGYPFIIPKSVYRGKPETSILTYAVNDNMICRSDLDEKIAYDIAQTLIENKSHLIQMNSIYSLLNFDYDKQVLSFPVHRGVRHYLNRNEPPVWFNYVKMVWPLISISVVVFGVIASLRQRLKRRKKQNIEMYYNRLIEIRDQTETAKDLDSYIKILKELKGLRSDAMKSLADKKLDPGESFNIFLALYNEVRSEVKEHITELSLKKQ